MPKYCQALRVRSRARSSASKFVASSVILAALAIAPQALAGDLNAEVDAMFNNLGSVGNYTQPGGFRGQTYNTYTGGSLFLRSPNKVYQLATIAYPTAKAGCGGIDLFGGSFSHISGNELKTMLKNITSALPGVAFQLALDTVSPLLGSETKTFQHIMTLVNNARINSCETANALVSGAAGATGFQSTQACAALAVQLGLEADTEAALKRCGADRAGVLKTARTSTDPSIKAQAPFVGNVTWVALQSVTNITNQERELIMSMVGTVIFYAEEDGKAPTVIAPTLTSIAQLLYGQSDAGNGNVNVHLLTCNDYISCDGVSDNPNYVHTPFTKKVQDLMTGMSLKIATRTSIPNNSAEVGFVNQTTEPVYQMLSIGNMVPGTGFADQLILQYRDVIAADYAANFLERNVRMGMAALDSHYQLDDEKRKKVRVIQDHARDLLAQLLREKATLYAKTGSFASVASNLEAMQRTLLTKMPKHIMDMLGFSARMSMR